MKTKLALFAVSASVLLTVFFYFTRRNNYDDKVITTGLTSIDRVEICLINNRRQRAIEYIDEFPVNSKGSLTDSRSRENMLRFIQPYLNEPNYRTDIPKCDLQFGAAFRLWQHDKYVGIIACFNCNLLYVQSAHTGDRDFSPDRPLLVGMLKQAFPNDPLVQKLNAQEPDMNDLHLESNHD